MLAAIALNGSGKAWRLQNNPIDFAMRVLAGIWLLYLLTGKYQLLAGSEIMVFDPLPTFVIGMVNACLLASLALFLLTAAGVVRRSVLVVIGLQLIGGLIAAMCLSWGVRASPEIEWLSTALALLVAALVMGSVVEQVRVTRSCRSWLVLAACAMGLGMWLYQTASADKPPSALPVAYHLYALFIFVVWKFVSLGPDANRAVADEGTLFGPYTNFQTLTSDHADDEIISLALRGERQRISYELHDNVGSQIVSILFALQAPEKPQNRHIMLSLEQCLNDLKMMVDALDSFEENVAEALGRLRYRVQHALDRQDIKMHWDVDLSPELEAVHGIYAQQVLRIAQESVSNIMRHANASSVKVACHFVPEFGQLILEVSDNGVGFKRDENNCAVGHGLEGMKTRAAAVGGILHIGSGSGSGTCVRLTLPLPNLKLPPKEILRQAAKSAAPVYSARHN